MCSDHQFALDTGHHITLTFELVFQPLQNAENYKFI